MRDKLQGAVLGALVAAFATVLLAQTPPPWTTPRTWTTGDLLTASQFNSNFRDNLLNLRASAACADSGITGTASADTVLFGDCRWDDIPATTVVALDMGNTTTTASTFQTVGPTGSLDATSGQTIALYLSGRTGLLVGCRIRIVNMTTATDIVNFLRVAGYSLGDFTSNLFVDSSPSTTASNTYAVQMRRDSGSNQCQFWTEAQNSQTPFIGTQANARGFIATVIS